MTLFHARRLCSWCGATLGFIPGALDSHGICPRCALDLQRSVQDLDAPRLAMGRLPLSQRLLHRQERYMLVAGVALIAVGLVALVLMLIQ